jgi:hypothetical protein
MADEKKLLDDGQDRSPPRGFRLLTVSGLIYDRKKPWPNPAIEHGPKLTTIVATVEKFAEMDASIDESGNVNRVAGIQVYGQSTPGSKMAKKGRHPTAFVPWAAVVSFEDSMHADDMAEEIGAFEADAKAPIEEDGELDPEQAAAAPRFN